MPSKREIIFCEVTFDEIKLICVAATSAGVQRDHTCEEITSVVAAGQSTRKTKQLLKKDLITRTGEQGRCSAKCFMVDFTHVLDLLNFATEGHDSTFYCTLLPLLKCSQALLIRLSLILQLRSELYSKNSADS